METMQSAPQVCQHDQPQRRNYPLVSSISSTALPPYPTRRPYARQLVDIVFFVVIFPRCDVTSCAEDTSSTFTIDENKCLLAH